MKKQILDRYRRDEAGCLVIDIAAEKVSDLYDDFDKHAPFLKKELDYDLVEYLIDSAREIGRESFGICFLFASPVDQELEQRLCKSVRNYFSYLLETNRREIMQALRSSVILLSLGLAMLAVSIYLNLTYHLDDAVVEGVMAEGLVIAAWVSVWEGLALLLMNGPALLKDRRLYAAMGRASLSIESGLDPAEAELQ